MQEVLAQITWYHNLTVLDKAINPVECEWYTWQVIQHGWSRNVLVHHIEGNPYRRQGTAILALVNLFAFSFIIFGELLIFLKRKKNS